MIEDLRNNIEKELSMAKELSGFIDGLNSSTESEKNLTLGVINSLKNRIKITNNSLPEMIRNITLNKKLQSEKKEVRRNLGKEERTGVVIHKKDENDYFKELNISESLIKKLKKEEKHREEKLKDFRKPSVYGKISNKFFLGVSERWVREGRFKKLGLDLRRSNLSILTTTYISMLLLSIVLSFFIGIGFWIFFIFFKIGISFPFLEFADGGYLFRLLKFSWLIIAMPLLMGVSFYFFPSAEKRALAGRINQELPFVVIHMSSISGSGIDPIEIFRIIGKSREYKFTRKEIRKIINQTNIYGYDLSTALRNVAASTPSSKLSELLNGIGTTINSGGDIKTFFQKRGESLLLEYRLEREKFTKTAETFMDIYISLVIAAPMILLMLLIMISVSGIATGFGVTEMSLAIIGIVAIINIIFLTFLHLKSPGY